MHNKKIGHASGDEIKNEGTTENISLLYSILTFLNETEILNTLSFYISLLYSNGIVCCLVCLTL